FFEWKNANNSHLKVIFTVSPVRHLGDGFHENTLSKSILHLAVDALTKKWNCYYFPSYEIFEDDLRDYRFYDKDLCHPAQQGIDYVKEILSQSFFSETTLQQLKIVEKENKMLNHRRLSNDYA
ncbi:MAG: GSCFA domain-containing protein, partial [Bacteroidales bacterium]|nr:GSCFA domain-containing protein [Bacteroidales bacterium]